MSSASAAAAEPVASAVASVIVIGAGWYGLAAAKTYLEVDPTIALTLIDADSNVGGVWSGDRVYPGLVADSPAGLFEYSDLKLSEELGVEEWADITGDQVHRYLERYARRFGVLERCRFRTTVDRIDRQGPQWRVHVRTEQEGGEILQCDKLIVATGITSQPRWPNLDTAAFDGKVLHSKDLGRSHPFLTSPAVKSVIVVGGNKSAVEAVTMCATAGKSVTWLIRKDGNGPGILFATRNRKGQHRAAAGASRWSSVFRPGIYAAPSWIHRFLYSGRYRIGTWLCQRFWRIMTKMMITNRQSSHPNLKLLNPEITNFFWLTSGVSFMHDTEETLMRLVEEGTLVHIFHQHIVAMKGSGVHTNTGQIVEADAVVFATGWKSSQSDLFDTSTAERLGLPIHRSEEEAIEAAYWERMRATGVKEVFDLYPALRNPPRQPISHSTTPYRLFRTIVPPKLAAIHDNSIAFVGMISNNQVSTHAEISGLWAVAYLTGKLYETPVGNLLADQSQMDMDVARMNAFMEKRYLGRKAVPDAAMEVQDYTDRMMQDLGLRTDRKRMRAPASWLGYLGWKAEYWLPYMPRDYLGVVQEVWG